MLSTDFFLFKSAHKSLNCCGFMWVGGGGAQEVPADKLMGLENNLLYTDRLLLEP